MSEEHPLTENHPAAAPGHHDEPELAGSPEKPAVTPAMALAFIIIALLGVLIVLGVRATMTRSPSGSADLTELQAEANALRDQLNRERMAMGLRPLEGSSEPIENIASRIKKDTDTIVALSGSFQSMLSEKDAVISAKNAELLRSEQLRQSLAAEGARLQSELQRALVNGSSVDQLRGQIDSLKSERDALNAELAKVRQDLAAKGQGVSEDDFADLKRRFDETQRAKDFFEAKVNELQAQLQAEQSKSHLFAKSENELLPAAVELFRSLRKLENRPEAEIQAAYAELGGRLGANVLTKLSFATGSSGLSPADQQTVRNLVAEIPDGDLLLAIGYASETGNVDKNQTLSSDRATAVAELFSSVKRPGQLVQAVYLGQTDRFGSKNPESNQVVEIWHIRKK